MPGEPFELAPYAHAPQEMDDFLRERYASVVRVVALAVGDPVLAEDAVQEACARCWSRLQRGQSFDNIGAWITRASLNYSKDLFRRKQVEARYRQRHAGDDRAPAHDNAQLDRVGMKLAIYRLPRRQREVIVLHYYSDLSVVEIADLLEISPSTVKTALVRGRSAIADADGVGSPVEEG